MKYSAGRVVTVRELKIGEKFHCGMIAGVCAEWEVILVMHETALVRLGGTTLGVTGTDLRNVTAYHASECPFCRNSSLQRPSEQTRYSTLTSHLEGSNIKSSANFINQPVERSVPGGAFVRGKRNTHLK